MAGTYDALIGIPISGQPISSGAYGIPVRAAIIDLDRRLLAMESTNAVGKVFSTTNATLTSATETLVATIAGYTFQAGIAYEATMRYPVRADVAGSVGDTINLRLRKTNVAGADWGEFFRAIMGPNGLVVSNTSMIYLLNTTAADIVSDVAMTAQYSSWVSPDSGTLFATTASPRFLTIRPTGFAADFVGMGVAVS